jgi:uncharacterized protein YkwD
MTTTRPRPVLAALLFCPFIFPLALAAQDSPSGPEKFLFEAVNRERTRQGRNALKWDADLAAAARVHAKRMAEHNSLSHQFHGEPDLNARLHEAGARFSRIAENVAEAPDLSGLHIGWMNSPPHYANIMNPKLNSIGIAVELRGTQFFAVQDFSTSTGALTAEQQEKKISKLLEARGVRVTGDSADARKSCESGGGVAVRRSAAITHFDAPDLEQLPEKLVKTIESGRYRTAAVGACHADESTGFSLYRITVLLY